MNIAGETSRCYLCKLRIFVIDLSKRFHLQEAFLHFPVLLDSTVAKMFYVHVTCYLLPVTCTCYLYLLPVPVISPDRRSSATGCSSETAAQCPLCRLQLGSVKCFNSHTERDGVGYKCRVCDHRTRHKSAMCRHVRVHTGEKPFSCPYCPHRTATGQNINSHIRNVHRG